MAYPISSNRRGSRPCIAATRPARIWAVCTKSFRCPACSEASWRLSVNDRALASSGATCCASIPDTPALTAIVVAVERPVWFKEASLRNSCPRRRSYTARQRRHIVSGKGWNHPPYPNVVSSASIRVQPHFLRAVFRKLSFDAWPTPELVEPRFGQVVVGFQPTGRRRQWRNSRLDHHRRPLRSRPWGARGTSRPAILLRCN